MILRRVTLFPYYDLGGLWKISNEMTLSIGGPTIFFLHLVFEDFGYIDL